MTQGGQFMDCHEKEELKKSLADPAHIFTDSELQQIIDQVFFDDDTVMDSELVDLATQRLASLRGYAAEEQYRETANATLKKFFNIGK